VTSFVPSNMTSYACSASRSARSREASADTAADERGVVLGGARAEGMREPPPLLLPPLLPPMLPPLLLRLLKALSTGFFRLSC
jgi:hypothetical protein